MNITWLPIGIFLIYFYECQISTYMNMLCDKMSWQETDAKFRLKVRVPPARLRGFATGRGDVAGTFADNGLFKRFQEPLKIDEHYWHIEHLFSNHSKTIDFKGPARHIHGGKSQITESFRWWDAGDRDRISRGKLIPFCLVEYYMGVSKNRGTPKWMVYNGKPNEMDDFGIPNFLEHPYGILWQGMRGDSTIPDVHHVFHQGQGRGLLAADLRFLGRQQFGLRGWSGLRGSMAFFFAAKWKKLEM